MLQKRLKVASVCAVLLIIVLIWFTLFRYERNLSIVETEHLKLKIVSSSGYFIYDTTVQLRIYNKLNGVELERRTLRTYDMYADVRANEPYTITVNNESGIVDVAFKEGGLTYDLSKYLN